MENIITPQVIDSPKLVFPLQSVGSGLPQTDSPLFPFDDQSVKASEEAARSSVRGSVNCDYRELKRIIVQESLLEKQPRFYLLRFALVLGLLGASGLMLLTISNPWLQMLNAVCLGIISAQVAFLGHDAGHRQIARTTRGNDIIGYLVANLLSGVSFTWWLNDHNHHHSHANDLENDPNLDYPVLAFDESQLASKRGWCRFIVKHQRYFFFPILSLSGLNLKCGSVKFMLSHRFPTRSQEALLIAIHYVLYFGLLISLLGWWAVPFIILHQFSWGIFLGSVFAPNHKGMPLISGEDRKDFLRSQVLTSRNITAHPVTDFLYGGLNYQIEHHLFPTIPRNRMRDLKKIVKPFCRQRSVSYQETSTLGSYQEIIS
jgi:fatty acid desaturase